MHQLPRRDVVHLADVHNRPRIFTRWERYRHRQAHWFIECVAETVSISRPMLGACLFTITMGSS